MKPVMNPRDRFVIRRTAVLTQKAPAVESDKDRAIDCRQMPDSLVATGILDHTVVEAAIRADAFLLWIINADVNPVQRWILHV